MATGERFLFKFHDPAKAADEFKKVIKIDPWYGQGYMLLGLAQMQLQHWSDAQWAFEEATKVEPGNAKAFLGVGSALNEQHDYVGAQKALEHSLDLNPHWPRHIMSLPGHWLLRESGTSPLRMRSGPSH